MRTDGSTVGSFPGRVGGPTSRAFRRHGVGWGPGFTEHPGPVGLQARQAGWHPHLKGLIGEMRLLLMNPFQGQSKPDSGSFCMNNTQIDNWSTLQSKSHTISRTIPSGGNVSKLKFISQLPTCSLAGFPSHLSTCITSTHMVKPETTWDSSCGILTSPSPTETPSSSASGKYFPHAQSLPLLFSCSATSDFSSS